MLLTIIKITKQLSTFLNEVLGSEYRFIAIQQDEWIKMRSHFIELKEKINYPNLTN